MTRRLASSRPQIREAVLVAIGSSFAAVAFTWPLVLHLQSRARDLKDTLFQAWTLDWVQYAITHGKSVYDANIFAPQQTTLAYSDTLLGIAVPTLPLRWMGMSPIGVLNVALILGFAASAAAGYLFVRLVTGSRTAAAIGGAVYAFGPFGALAARHLHVAVRPGIPLAAAAAWWLAERARARGSLRAPAIALVAVVAWQGTVSFYPATYAVGAAALVLLVRLRDRRSIVVGVVALGACGAVLALLAIPNLEIASRDPRYEFGLETFGPLGANFFRTEPGISVWGGVLGVGDGDALTSGVFPGLTVLLLAGWGAIRGWRRKGRSRTIVITGLTLTAVGALLAIGTSATGLRQYAPYRLLYELGPPFDALRATVRAWSIGLCGLALLAGIGGVAFVERARRVVATRAPARGSLAAGAATALVVVLLLVEGFDPWSDRPRVPASPVDVELARRSAEGGVVSLPMNEGETLDLSLFEQPAVLYGATEHHRLLLNGYAGYVPQSYLDVSNALAELPSPQAIRTLERLDIRFVVVRPSAGRGRWAALRFPEQAEPLRLLGRFGDDLLYEVPAGISTSTMRSPSDRARPGGHEVTVVNG